jgi:hypothetical protein
MLFPSYEHSNLICFGIVTNVLHVTLRFPDLTSRSAIFSVSGDRRLDPEVDEVFGRQADRLRVGHGLFHLDQDDVVAAVILQLRLVYTIL